MLPLKYLMLYLRSFAVKMHSHYVSNRTIPMDIESSVYLRVIDGYIQINEQNPLEFDFEMTNRTGRG
jgi:hypothetical protein